MLTGYDRCLDCQNFTACETCELIGEIPEEELLSLADNEHGSRKDWKFTDFLSECFHGILYKCRKYVTGFMKSGDHVE